MMKIAATAAKIWVHHLVEMKNKEPSPESSNSTPVALSITICFGFLLRWRTRKKFDMAAMEKLKAHIKSGFC